MGAAAPFVHLGRVGTELGIDLVRFLGASLRFRTALAVKNLFHRKQLALYRERQVKPRRASDPLRVVLVLLARCFAWRKALTIVRPATLIRWHRQAFRLLWRWRSRPGRPRLPADLQRLIGSLLERAREIHRNAHQHAGGGGDSGRAAVLADYIDVGWRPGSLSSGGGGITTPYDRTASWAIGPRRPRRHPGRGLHCLPDRS